METDKKLEPRISIITLGVENILASVDFYKRLGFPTDYEKGDFAMFKLKNITLALFPKDSLAKDAGAELTKNGFSGITLAYNVKTEKQVDEVIKHAESIGATITDKPHKRDWGGYSGYFSDPDGYLWEIAYNPHSPELAE